MQNVKLKLFLKDEKKFIDHKDLLDDYRDLLIEALKENETEKYKLTISTLVKDIDGEEIYNFDIVEFDEDERLHVLMEEFMGFYVDDIGDEECADFVTELNRLSDARIIGNSLIDKGLLDD